MRLLVRVEWPTPGLVVLLLRAQIIDRASGGGSSIGAGAEKASLLALLLCDGSQLTERWSLSLYRKLPAVVAARSLRPLVRVTLRLLLVALLARPPGSFVVCWFSAGPPGGPSPTAGGSSHATSHTQKSPAAGSASISQKVRLDKRLRSNSTRVLPVRVGCSSRPLCTSSTRTRRTSSACKSAMSSRWTFLAFSRPVSQRMLLLLLLVAFTDHCQPRGGGLVRCFAPLLHASARNPVAHARPFACCVQQVDWRAQRQDGHFPQVVR